MRCASIDLGSNSIRLLIADFRGGALTPERYEMATTRLAGGLSRDGVLSEMAMERSFKTLEEFSRILQAHSITRLRCAATGALREAGNADEFIRRVKQGIGMDIRVLSGQEEAGITALGVLTSVPHHDNSVILDIGGGSTEVILCRDKHLADACSLPIGVVKLVDRHLHSDPPTAAEISSIDADAAKAARAFIDRIPSLIRDDLVLLGTAGSITTLASIDLGLVTYDSAKVHGHMMSVERLRSMSGLLTGMTMEERKTIKGLSPDRADLIIAGIRLTIGLMAAFRFGSIVVSDHGLLEGLLITEAGEAVPSAS